MISKTLGQLTHTETQLWEQVFCHEHTNFRRASMCEEAADAAIQTLRAYHAERKAEVDNAAMLGQAPDGTEGIVGTYCPIAKGWWKNGPKVPVFVPKE